MTTYYVDATGGRDPNSGTSVGEAWKTLGKVFNEFNSGTFAGGDSILFKRGETWRARGRARLRVRNVSGTSLTSPLYIGAYGTGSKPKLDGEGDLASFIIGNNATVDGAVSYVVVEDIAVTGSTAQQVYLLGPGITGWWFRRLDVGEMGGSTGLGIQLRACSWVVIDGCNVTRDGDAGEIIYIGKSNGSDDVHHVYIVNNHVHDTGELECIDLKHGSHHVVIENNTIENAGNECVSLRGHNHIVRDNVITNPRGPYGIAQWYQGDNNIVENNLIKNINGTNGRGIQLDAGSGHIIRNNTIVDVAADAVRISASNVTLRNNVYSDCDYGLRVAGGISPDADYDCFHRCAKNDVNWAGTGKSRVQARKDHGIEHNGINSDPSFLETTNYSIDLASACYEAGANVGRKQYGGTNRSIGWWEPGFSHPYRVIIDDFASGDLSKWDAWHGGSHRLEINIDGTQAVYVAREDLGGLNECHVAFWLNPNTLSMGSGDVFSIVSMLDSSNNPVAKLRLRESNGNLQLQVGYNDDSGASHYSGGSTIQSDAWQWVEFALWQSTGAGDNNGCVYCKVDGDFSAQLFGLDNDTRTVDGVRIGAVTGIDTTTSGTIYMDNIVIDGPAYGIDFVPEETVEVTSLSGTSVFAVRLPDALADQVKETVAAEGLSVSAWLGMLIESNI